MTIANNILGRLLGREPGAATSAAAKSGSAEAKAARRAGKNAAAKNAGAKTKAGAGKAGRPKFQAPPDDGKVRLNLGSGDKNLPGYVNIDVAPSRKGAAPDLLCDLRALKLEDDYADELLSVHVIEHFYYWEVQELLAEWRRVIKPGGRIELECPNLAYAAQQIVEDERRLADPDEGWRTTMFVLYGDPAWKDPLMCHRWGWTPRTLGAELERAGFVDVREEPALFKRGNPRDMRVVAVKPSEE